jgi:hypothetical protein
MKNSGREPGGISHTRRRLSRIPSRKATAAPAEIHSALLKGSAEQILTERVAGKIGMIIRRATQV